MDRLQLLIRLTRQTLDERCSELGNVVRVRAEAEAAIAAHEQHLANEYELAATNPEALAAFSAWAAHAARRKRELQSRHSELGRIEAAAREALREAFADTSRLEVAQEANEKTERKLNSRKAESRADELHMLRRMIDAS